MIVELLVVLMALVIGARYGSLALGTISGIGLAILVFGFQLKPGTPPTDVIYMIIAAVTCAGVLQASGGMDWMIQIAERLLRKHPDRITLLAPPHHILSYRHGGNGPRGVYPHAHYMRHCAEERHPPGAPLRHSEHSLADRHHVFAHIGGRCGLRVYIGCQRLQRE